MKNKKQQSSLRFYKVRWVIPLSIVIVVGSVMSFGLVCFARGIIEKNDAIYMLGMIIPMTFFVTIGINFALKSMERQVKPLLDGIQDVSQGHLDVHLDVVHGGQYSNLFMDFNLMVDELKNTKEEMDSFINTFAHEFKTPITAIGGFADYLCETGEGIETQERMEYLKMISDESERLLHLSQNALLLSKVEALKIVTEKKEFSISEQIRRCAIMFMKTAQEKHIDIILPDDVNITYVGNEELIEHIWTNLLSNAMKFSHEGGQIMVTEEKTQEGIKIAITDQGVGMSPEVQKRIFNKYYQHDGTSLVKGNGIGLALVKNIALLCGGDVSVSSEPDSGSTFTVILK